MVPPHGQRSEECPRKVVLRIAPVREASSDLASQRAYWNRVSLERVRTLVDGLPKRP